MVVEKDGRGGEKEGRVVAEAQAEEEKREAFSGGGGRVE